MTSWASALSLARKTFSFNPFVFITWITSFIDKPGQILFNRKSIGNIHRNELFNQKDVLRDKNSNLATELQKKNRDLYVNYFGELREKETIETHYDFKERVNVYYFDRN